MPWGSRAPYRFQVQGWSSATTSASTYPAQVTWAPAGIDASPSDRASAYPSRRVKRASAFIRSFLRGRPGPPFELSEREARGRCLTRALQARGIFGGGRGGRCGEKGPKGRQGHKGYESVSG